MHVSVLRSSLWISVCPLKIALYVILLSRVSSERTLAAFKKIPSPLSPVLLLLSICNSRKKKKTFVPSSSPLLSLSTGDISTPSGEKLTINLTSYSLSRFHPLVSSQRRARFCSSCRKACFSISFLNSPCRLPSSSVCWPHSAIRCWSSTATAFAFWMVERR